MVLPITIEILVVEDDPIWQKRHKRKSEALLGQGNAVIASTYGEALSLLEGREFDAYIIDGEFPRSNGNGAEHLGLELALFIEGRKPGPKIIRIVSRNTLVLDQAQRRELITYTKGLAEQKKGYRDVTGLYQDVAIMLVASQSRQT